MNPPKPTRPTVLPGAPPSIKRAGQTHLDNATPKTVPMKVKTGLKGRPLTKLAPWSKADTLCYHPKVNHNSTLIFLMRLP